NRVLAQDQSSGPAVVAVTAVLVRVHAHQLARPEPGHPGPQLIDDADHLVPRHQREDRVEVALVQVQVGATEPDLDDPQPDLPGPRLRSGDVGDGETAGGVVADSLHGVSSGCVHTDET